MSTTFTHLHVAASTSVRHGTDSPAALVARAADLGMDALALTDRDGLYGAVKHVVACTRAGLAPLLGVDLAVEPEPAGPGSTARLAPVRRPTPARGGALVDPGLPRVVVLAHAGGSALAGPGAGSARSARSGGALPAGAGYAALCHLVSAVHARSDGAPVATAALIGRHAAGGTLSVLLGPDSPVGRAVAANRQDVAAALLARWYDLVPPGCLAVELVARPSPWRPGVGDAARALALARRAGVPAVLTNAVRHARPEGARLAQVLDASRLLVPLGSPHLPPVSGHAHLASPARMRAVAEQVARAAGEEPARLLAETAALARRCRLDPAADLGVGRVRLPEPSVLGLDPGQDPDAVLRARCQDAVERRYPHASSASLAQVRRRTEQELAVIADLGYARYFLTVALACDTVRSMGVRVAARGSGVGSVVNHLIGVSDVEPLGHGLLMERFLTAGRADLPDVDLDVESARRTEVCAAIAARFGHQRVAALSMLVTHRVRHAVRAAGAALGLAPEEVDAIATAFPRVHAARAREAMASPELAGRGLDAAHLRELFDLVEQLDGVPRDVSTHPCGLLVSDAALGDVTPVQASSVGPTSQYEKDDVEALGLIKLDVLGVRMQSAIAHALVEVARTTGEVVDLDAQPLEDPDTYRVVRSARTLGIFQVESPGQRELVGRLAPQGFTDLVVDISLFRPGPVACDMITPFLAARHGWAPRAVLHGSVQEVLAETEGVVVFHEQVLRIVATTAGTSLAIADRARRAMADRAGRQLVRGWWWPRALAQGLAPAEAARVWDVLEAFAAFGFCKAHAVAFATTTYRSAWLKTHHPAAFFAGLLTHDPGMYPRRVLLSEARALGIAILPLDVNASDATCRAVPPADGSPLHRPARALADSHGTGVALDGQRADAAVPDARGWGVRLSLSEVAGISAAEVGAIVAGRPYASLADLLQRAAPSSLTAERLVVAGALDGVHATAEQVGSGRTEHGRDGAEGRADAGGRAGRRDLLLALDDHRRGAPRRRSAPEQVRLDLDLGVDLAGRAPAPSGLQPMTASERVRAEVEVTGLDASQHLLHAYAPLLAAAGVVRSTDLVHVRSRQRVLVAGVKIAQQTPPVRSGARVLFLSLDDGAGALDATFFADAQRDHAAVVLTSWLLLVAGRTRRTGSRGVSVRAEAAWDLPGLWRLWRAGGPPALAAALSGDPAWVGSSSRGLPLGDLPHGPGTGR